MRLRLAVELRIATVADAITVRNYLQNQIDARTVEVISPINSTVEADGTVSASWEGFFTDRTELVSLYDDVKAKWTSGALSSKILAGSRVVRHDCRHDEGRGDCRDATLVQVGKG